MIHHMSQCEHSSAREIAFMTLHVEVVLQSLPPVWGIEEARRRSHIRCIEVILQLVELCLVFPELVEQSS